MHITDMRKIQILVEEIIPDFLKVILRFFGKLRSAYLLFFSVKFYWTRNSSRQLISLLPLDQRGNSLESKPNNIFLQIHFNTPSLFA